MSTVTVSFAPLPTHVRTARLVAVATARRAGVDEDLIDEIRFAVGEACSRAVVINAASSEPVVMTIADELQKLRVEVHDKGTEVGSPADADLSWLAANDVSIEAGSAGPGLVPDPLPSGFGLAVIRGLVEDVAIEHDDTGTRVMLSWPLVPAVGSPAIG